MPCDLRKRLFAKFYDRAVAKYEEAMASRKRELLASLDGVVVEIGPGTGTNLALLPKLERWIGVEPNPHMHEPLLAKAEALGFEADLRLLDADGLPCPNASVDHVLSTLVLCSVPDPLRTLAEVRRVLKPGGTFVFWEHVLSSDSRPHRFLQHMMNPFQRVIADGCRANRDLAKDIAEAGFQELEVENFQLPKGLVPPWIRPHIAGRARV